MIRIEARHHMALPLGREGENLAREIIFDISDWQSKYGNGIVSLIAQRPCDDAPYPCAITIDCSTVIWPITYADTAWHGNYGECELQYRVGDVLVKSETWCTSILNALGDPSAEVPEPHRGWVDQVIQAGSDAQISAEQSKSNADMAAESASSAEISAKAAQDALRGMTYVTFSTDENGHIVISNGDLLGTTGFSLIHIGEDTKSGHLEVDY